MHTHTLRRRGQTGDTSSKAKYKSLTFVFLRVQLKGNGIRLIPALDFGFLTKCANVTPSPSLSLWVLLWLSVLYSSLFLYFSLSIHLSVSQENKCHKSARLNSAHTTFPSHLIASIQFISASHARPQSIKHALLQRSSCPLITPIIKVQESWVRPSRLTGETNRFFNSPRQEANQSQPLCHQAFERKLGSTDSSRDLGISTQAAGLGPPLYHRQP